ncbi:hypothetical protein BD309DRAFT_530297 [Dichomitus squalens]|nr:hypothetical protein BD309DRAFT_530297 [Dichomitus squalens]
MRCTPVPQYVKRQSSDSSCTWNATLRFASTSTRAAARYAQSVRSCVDDGGLSGRSTLALPPRSSSTASSTSGGERLLDDASGVRADGQRRVSQVPGEGSERGTRAVSACTVDRRRGHQLGRHQRALALKYCEPLSSAMIWRAPCSVPTRRTNVSAACRPAPTRGRGHPPPRSKADYCLQHLFIRIRVHTLTSSSSSPSFSDGRAPEDTSSADTFTGIPRSEFPAQIDDEEEDDLKHRACCGTRTTWMTQRRGWRGI